MKQSSDELLKWENINMLRKVESMVCTPGKSSQSGGPNDVP